jgi:hypothetical protein
VRRRRAMSARRAALALLAGAVVLLGVAGAASAAGALRVTVDRAQARLPLGGTFAFRSTVANTGARTTPDLVAHLNVVGLDPDIYVDPEDWSPRRTLYLGPLEPGRSTTLDWDVKAVTGGDLAVAVVVFEQRPDGTVAPAPASSGRPIAVHVVERRTLDSGGILPLALGVSGVVGAAAVVSRRVRRVRTSGPAA